VGENLDLPLDKWSVIALREDWIGRWNQSAMFPSELVFFLAFCEHSGIKRIFESGRYEGYSTERLAAYAEREGADVYSVDLESRPDIAERGRERLSKYPSVHLIKGDAFPIRACRRHSSWTGRSSSAPSACCLPPPRSRGFA
jgi:hypothetical protein